MVLIVRYFSKKRSFSANILMQLLLNVSKTPIFISNYMKYKRFGKWVFDSVLFNSIDTQYKMMQEAHPNE